MWEHAIKQRAVVQFYKHEVRETGDTGGEKALKLPRAARGSRCVSYMMLKSSDGEELTEQKGLGVSMKQLKVPEKSIPVKTLYKKCLERRDGREY